jgi:DNA polymerase-3 subunit delta'
MTVPIAQWHATAWQQLQGSRRQERLPHALLISGEEGIGKREFAEQLAASLLCEQPGQDGQACGQCPACQRLAAQSHPDRFRLVPEESGKPIKIGAVRELIQNLSLTGHYGGYRVVTVVPAEVMNHNAANAFLKTLEEPPPRTLIMLVSTTPSRLPATIRSRCQPLRLGRPEPQAASDWLAETLPDSPTEDIAQAMQLAGEAPLLAARYLREDWLAERRRLLEALLDCASGQTDPLTAAGIAQEALKQDRQMPIIWMYHWVADLLRLAYDKNNIKNKDLADKLQKQRQQAAPRDLHRLLDKLHQARRLSETTVNPQLLWENLMIEWSSLFAPNKP